MANRISPKEFKKEMKSIKEQNDKESRHMEGDILMEKTLRQNGFAEGVEVFHSMEKWYS